MDYSIRIPVTDGRMNTLETSASSRNRLPKVKDILFKPKGIPLSRFHPKDMVIRLREFEDRIDASTLIKMHFIKSISGYSDRKEQLAKGKTHDLEGTAEKMGYEKWGEILTDTVEYELGKEYIDTKVLLQDISHVGKMLKVEAKKRESLNNLIKIFKVSSNEKIIKNAGVLLAEKLVLI